MAKRKKGNTGQLKMEFNTPSKPKTQSVGSKLNRTEALRNKAKDLGINKTDNLRTQNTNKPNTSNNTNTSSNTKASTGNKPSDRANRTKDLRAKNVGSKEAIAQAKINKLRTNNKSLEAAKKIAKSPKDKKLLAYALGYGGAALIAAAAGGAFSDKKSDTKSSAAKAKAKTKTEDAKKTETKKTETKKTETAKTETKATDNTSIEQKVKDVIRGKYGTGAARKAALGADYDKVQAEVNKKMAASKLKTTPAKTTSAKTETQDSPVEYTGPKELQMTAEQRMYDNIDKLKKEKMKKGGMVKMKYGGTMKPTMKKGGLVKKKK
jgi:hypothetical protein